MSTGGLPIRWDLTRSNEAKRAAKESIVIGYNERGNPIQLPYSTDRSSLYWTFTPTLEQNKRAFGGSVITAQGELSYEQYNAALAKSPETAKAMTFPSAPPVSLSAMPGGPGGEDFVLAGMSAVPKTVFDVNPAVPADPAAMSFVGMPMATGTDPLLQQLQQLSVGDLLQLLMVLMMLRGIL